MTTSGRPQSLTEAVVAHYAKANARKPKSGKPATRSGTGMKMSGDKK